jgi:hypothetical protein
LSLSSHTTYGKTEFGGCDLGHMSRTNRLVSIAAGLARNSDQAFSSSCGINGAQYISNFLDCKEVTDQSVLAGHINATGVRCGTFDRIIAVQDTTHLDFSSHKALNDLGPIGPSKSSKGLMMHTIMALSPGGTPQGILGTQIWARKPGDYGIKARRHKRLLTDKESNKWLVGLSQADAGVPDGTPLVVVGDRESDIYGLFVAPRRATTDLLVRANQDRSVESVDEECKLMSDVLKKAPVLGGYEIEIPRNNGRKARKAQLVVQAAKMRVKSPQNGAPGVKKGFVDLYVLRVRELSAVDGGECLDWTLVTSLPVESIESARCVIRMYSMRWVIEEFHRVLKSNCRVEKIQFETIERLKPAIAILSVQAWRILFLTKESREHGDAPAMSVCTDVERRVLHKWMQMNNDKYSEIVTISDFVRATSILGGYKARKWDGPPGPKTLFIGLRRLEDLVRGYELAVSMLS